MNQDLPIVMEPIQLNRFYPHVFYNQALQMNDQRLERWLNKQSYEAATKLVMQQYDEQDTDTFTEMYGDYALKTNEKEIISSVYTNYAIFPQAAHGLTLIHAITIDLQNRQTFTLEEIFKENSDYVTVLSSLIKKQIVERNIPTFEPFTEIDKNQPFYIADKCIVIFFPIYAITPYYFGIPYFPISLYTLQAILKKDIFLQRLLENN